MKRCQRWQTTTSVLSSRHSKNMPRQSSTTFADVPPTPPPKHSTPKSKSSVRGCEGSVTVISLSSDSSSYTPEFLTLYSHCFNKCTRISACAIIPSFTTRCSIPILSMFDISLTLARIGLSKIKVKLVIIPDHGKTGLMITTKSSLDEKEHIQSSILYPRESYQ